MPKQWIQIVSIEPARLRRHPERLGRRQPDPEAVLVFRVDVILQDIQRRRRTQKTEELHRIHRRVRIVAVNDRSQAWRQDLGVRRAELPGHPGGPHRVQQLPLGPLDGRYVPGGKLVAIELGIGPDLVTLLRREGALPDQAADRPRVAQGGGYDNSQNENDKSGRFGLRCAHG